MKLHVISDRELEKYPYCPHCEKYIDEIEICTGQTHIMQIDNFGIWRKVKESRIEDERNFCRECGNEIELTAKQERKMTSDYFNHALSFMDKGLK